MQSTTITRAKITTTIKTWDKTANGPTAIISVNDSCASKKYYYSAPLLLELLDIFGADTMTLTPHFLTGNPAHITHDDNDAYLVGMLIRHNDHVAAAVHITPDNEEE